MRILFVIMFALNCMIEVLNGEEQSITGPTFRIVSSARRAEQISRAIDPSEMRDIFHSISPSLIRNHFLSKQKKDNIFIQTEMKGIGRSAMRLAKAVSASSHSNPGLDVCLTLSIDLTSMGAPGVIVDISMDGDVMMNTCFECWTWVFDMHAVFRWGIRAWGLRAIEAAIEIEGNVKIDELPCVDVPHNKMQYCHFLQNIVPPEDSTMSKIQSVCHSDSPLDVVTSWLRNQVDSLKKKFHNHVESSFELKQHLDDIRIGVMDLTETLESESKSITSFQHFERTLRESFAPKAARYVRRALDIAFHSQSRGDVQRFEKKLRKLHRSEQKDGVVIINEKEIQEIANAYERTFGRPKDSIFKKIAKKTRNEIYSMLNVPCAHSMKHADHRVANFHTLILSLDELEDTKILDLVAVAESLAGLFIRVVEDIQAIFNILVTGAPDWNGHCLLLPPTHHTEDERVNSGRHYGPWNRADNRRDEKNPWCHHAFASQYRSQVRRIDFATRDNLESLKFHPQLQCILISTPELVQMDRVDIDATNFESKESKIFYFSHSCSQRCVSLNRVEKSLSGTVCPTSCERVELSKLFMTMNPELVKEFHSKYEEIGFHLENALVVGGLMLSRARTFPIRGEMNSRMNQCDGSYEHHKTVMMGTDVELKSLVRESISNLMNLVKDFLEEMSQEEWISRQILAVPNPSADVLARLRMFVGNPEVWIENMQQSVVKESTRSNIGPVLPLPARFSTLVRFGVSVRAGEAPNICDNVDASNDLQISGMHRIVSNAWSGSPEYQETCEVLRMDVFTRLGMSVSRCHHKSSAPRWVLELRGVTMRKPLSVESLRSRAMKWGNAVRTEIRSSVAGESPPNTRLRAGSARASSNRRRLLMTPETMIAWPFLSSLKPGIHDDGSGYLGAYGEMVYMYDDEMDVQENNDNNHETFSPVETVPIQEVSPSVFGADSTQAAPFVPLSSDPWVLMRALVAHFASKSFEKLDMKQIRQYVLKWLMSRYEKEFRDSKAETFEKFMKHELKKKISAGMSDSHVFSVSAIFERSTSGTHHLLEAHQHDVHVSFDSSYRKERRMAMNLPIPGLLHMESSVSVTQDYDMSRIWNVLYHTMKRVETEDEVSYSQHFDQCVSCFVIHAATIDVEATTTVTTTTATTPLNSRVEFCVADDLSDSKCVSSGDRSQSSCTSMPGFSSHVVYEVRDCIKIPERSIDDRFEL